MVLFGQELAVVGRGSSLRLGRMNMRRMIHLEKPVQADDPVHVSLQRFKSILHSRSRIVTLDYRRDTGFRYPDRDYLSTVRMRSEERRVGKECRSRWLAK